MFVSCVPGVVSLESASKAACPGLLVGSRAVSLISPSSLPRWSCAIEFALSTMRNGGRSMGASYGGAADGNNTDGDVLIVHEHERPIRGRYHPACCGVLQTGVRVMC